MVADYAQIELRVAALISRDDAMLSAYANGEDLHTKTAAAILGIEPSVVTKEQRQRAKAVSFGLLFGQEAEGLVRYARSAYGVEMTPEEAQAAGRAFFETYPDLDRWQRITSTASVGTGKATTPGGRVRDFTHEPNGYRCTEALSTPIQGGAAEMLMAALARLDVHLDGLDATLVNVVHDELVLEVAEADAQAAQRAVEAAMTEGYLTIVPEAQATLTGLVEVGVGCNWAEAKGG